MDEGQGRCGALLGLAAVSRNQAAQVKIARLARLRAWLLHWLARQCSRLPGCGPPKLLGRYARAPCLARGVLPEVAWPSSLGFNTISCRAQLPAVVRCCRVLGGPVGSFLDAAAARPCCCPTRGARGAPSSAARSERLCLADLPCLTSRLLHDLSLIHISEPTRHLHTSSMPSSA